MIAYFSEVDWREFEARQLKSLEVEIDGWTKNQLLNAPVDELCNNLVEKYRIDAPVLDKGNIALDQRETQIDVSRDPLRGIRDRSQPVYIPGTEIKITVPFIGEADIFKTRAPNHALSLNPLRGNVRGGAVVFSISDLELEIDKVKREIDERLDNIDNYLTRFHAGVDRLNNRLESFAHDYIEQRRGETPGEIRTSLRLLASNSNNATMRPKHIEHPRCVGRLHQHHHRQAQCHISRNRLLITQITSTYLRLLETWLK